MASAHIFQNSARTVYSSNLTDIQERTRGTTALTGGYYTALLNVIVIVVVPLLGVFFDKVGWRMPFGMLNSEGARTNPAQCRLARRPMLFPSFSSVSQR